MCLLEGSNIDHTKLQLNDNQCKGQLDGQRHMVTFTFNNSQPCGAEVTVGFPPPPLLILLFFFSSTSLSPPLLPPSPLLLHSDFSFYTLPLLLLFLSTSPRPLLLLLLLLLSDSWFGLLLPLVPLHPIPFLSDFSPSPSSSSNPLPLYVTSQTDNDQAIFKNTLSTMNSSSTEIIVRHDQVVLNFSCLYDAEKPQSATFKIKDGCV